MVEAEVQSSETLAQQIVLALSEEGLIQQDDSVRATEVITCLIDTRIMLEHY